MVEFYFLWSFLFFIITYVYSFRTSTSSGVPGVAWKGHNKGNNITALFQHLEFPCIYKLRIKCSIRVHVYYTWEIPVRDKKGVLPLLLCHFYFEHSSAQKSRFCLPSWYQNVGLSLSQIPHACPLWYFEFCNYASMLIPFLMPNNLVVNVFAYDIWGYGTERVLLI